MRPREEQPIPALILRDLAYGPATVKELEAVVGVKPRNLRYYLKLLQKQKLIYIGGWEQRTGPALPVWFIGDRADTPRPKCKYKRYGGTEMRKLEYKPRRPLNDDEPDGYMESPNDYVLNNVWFCEMLLDLYAEGKIDISEEELK